MANAVELIGITKRFPGVLANEDIRLSVAEGEIHALLGENGAGKTTLMGILSGLLRPDEGEIRIRGQKCAFRSPSDAIAQGIGMVHQHFMLVPTLTAAENIVLGHEPTRGPFLLRHEAVDRINRISKEFGLEADPGRLVRHLSVGQQQRVEILKMLYRGAEILIMDEPTAVITPPEAAALFAILRSMRERGKSVIFISHKLKEVMEISDRITVLRKGRAIDTVAKASTDEKRLAQMMIGRDVVLASPRKTGTEVARQCVVSLRRICARGDHGMPALRDVSLDLHAGEIVGVAGVDGNGQAELAEVIAGLRTAESGELLIHREDMTRSKPRARTERGIYYVPADRKARGAVGDLSVSLNTILKTHAGPPFSRCGLLDHARVREFAEGLVQAYDVRCPSVKVLARTLSGGNLQKLVLARETASQPVLLIAEQPTRGLDVSATEYVRQLLVRQRQGGAAVLLISADLDEILALSDRIVVMYEGEIVYTCPAEEASIAQVGLAMAGIAPRNDPGSG